MPCHKFLGYNQRRSNLLKRGIAKYVRPTTNTPLAGAWGNNLVNALTTLPVDKNRFDVNIIPISKIMDVIIDSNDLVGTSYQPTLYSAVFATTNILEKNYINF